jgi:hypothetical protein
LSLVVPNVGGRATSLSSFGVGCGPVEMVVVPRGLFKLLSPSRFKLERRVAGVQVAGVEDVEAVVVMVCSGGLRFHSTSSLSSIKLVLG